MISQCPHCSEVLRFSDAHQQKLANALENLVPGRSLKFACPKCKISIELDKTGEAIKKIESPKPSEPPPNPAKTIVPPKAPDISWLTQGEVTETEILDDVPTAMVLVEDTGLRDKATAALEENQYQIYIPDSIDAAMDSMRFKTYAVVVFFTGSNAISPENQDFHKFMMQMSMKKRRRIYYILLGLEFNTLFDLEALTNSANLVVNTGQLDHLSTLLKKGVKDYGALFAPYIATLKLHGKN